MKKIAVMGLALGWLVGAGLCFGTGAGLLDSGLLALDFSEEGLSLASTDITKLQGADFEERAKALKVGDLICFKTDKLTYTGRVTIAYRDVNMVETRAGYFNYHSQSNNEIWHITWDRDALVGWLEDTYLAKDYGILYKKATATFSSIDISEKDFVCGNDQEVSGLQLEAEDRAKIAAEKAADLAADTFYTNIWEVPEYTTESMMVCYTKEAYENQKAKGGINNQIAHGVVHGTLLLSNSHVRTCMRLVHSQMVPYDSRVGSSKTLGDFCGARNGCDEVYDWRCRYGADTCGIGIYKATYTGLAYVGSNKQGSPEGSPFICMDCGSMAGTGINHEYGHTRGGRHYIDTYSPGTSSLFDHSFGCHNTSPKGQREQGSVMARSSGLFNYFSSTNIYYDGVPISTNEKCRVADTWSKIRRYSCRYRCQPVLTEYPGLICAEEFDYPDGSSIMWREGGEGFASCWRHCNTNVFRVHNDGTGEHWLRITGPDKSSCTVDRTVFWGHGLNASHVDTMNTSFWFRTEVTPLNDREFDVGFESTDMSLIFDNGRVALRSRSTELPVGDKADVLMFVKLEGGTADRYVWVNPAPGVQPALADADLKYSGSSASFTLRGFKLEADKNASALVHCLYVGFTYDSVYPGRRPMFFTAEGGYDKDRIVLGWGGETPDSIEILRGTVSDAAAAAVVATLDEPGYTWTDTTPEQGIRYYYWLRCHYGERTVLTSPHQAVAGIPVNSACANGPYVAGQGQHPVLSAAGSQGYLPMVRWTVAQNDTVFLTNYYTYALDERLVMTPGEYPVRVEVTERDLDTDICTDVTTLTITNCYPHVTTQCCSDNLQAGLPLIFRADPWDPGTNDILTVRWRFPGEEDFCPWTNSYHMVHVFDVAGEQQYICQVQDNYGAHTAFTNTVVIAGSTPQPEFPQVVTCLDGCACVLILRNLGAAACGFSFEVPEELVIAPATGTLPASGLVPVYVARKDTTQTEAYTKLVPLTCNGKTENVRVRVLANKARARVQYSVAPVEGWNTALSAIGSTPGYRYLWSLDGAPLADPSASPLFHGSLPAEAGEHDLTLSLLDKDDKAVSRTNLTASVQGRAPAVFLEETAREGASATFQPVLAHPRAAEALVRYNWGEGDGWTVWQDPVPVRHTFRNPGQTYVQCEARIDDLTDGTSFYFDQEAPLSPVAEGPRGAVTAGTPVTLSATVSEEASRIFWRESYTNPRLGLLADNWQAVQTVLPAEPGEYLFLAYAAADQAVSAPRTVRVRVQAAEVPALGPGSLAGLTYTNTIYGCGIIAGCHVAVAGEGYYVEQDCADDGTFLFTGLPQGPCQLNITREGCLAAVLPATVGDQPATFAVPMELSDARAFLYAQVSDARSFLPASGLEVRIADQGSATTDKGRSSTFTLPLGDYLLAVQAPDRTLVVTNVSLQASGKTLVQNVTSEGYVPFVHGSLYGTGGETVTEGIIQVLSKVTLNVVQRYNVQGMPFYDIGLFPGHKSSFRFRLEEYDNENQDLAITESLLNDMVLTPEPGVLALLAAALLLLRRR